MGRKILVLDTNLTTRRMLRFAMELQGFQLFETADPHGALEAASARGGFDLLVIGLNSADDPNAAAIDLVRGLRGSAEMPILLVSEKAFKIRRDLWEIGFCAWLEKPFRMAELHQVVERLLCDVPPAAVRATAVADDGVRP